MVLLEDDDSDTAAIVVAKREVRELHKRPQ
jgi:hypothetical protein